jgi:hypothetical protein
MLQNFKKSIQRRFENRSVIIPLSYWIAKSCRSTDGNKSNSNLHVFYSKTQTVHNCCNYIIAVGRAGWDVSVWTGVMAGAHLLSQAPLISILLFSNILYSLAEHGPGYIISGRWLSSPGPTLQRHNTKNLKQIFPEKELRGHSPNSYIHVSVSDLYIPTMGLPTLLQEYRWTDRVNI